MTPLRSGRRKISALSDFFRQLGDRNFELLDLELAPGGRLIQQSPMPRAPRNFVLVYRGTLEIELGGEGSAAVLGGGRGSAIHYHADQAHTYRNSGTEMTRAAMVIYYPGK